MRKSPRGGPIDRLEQDTLIALAHQHSEAAVDLLGETLLADLETLRPAADKQGRTYLDGRSSRAQVVCTLLGRTGNPRASPLADLGRRPDRPATGPGRAL